MKLDTPFTLSVPMVAVLAFNVVEVAVPKYPMPETVSAVELAYVAFQLVDQPVVIVPSVDVAFAKRLRPLHVLLLTSSVEEAAVTVTEPPRETPLPLMVTLEFWSWLLPIVLVETKRVPSKARSVPCVKDVAFDPPLAIASAELRVSELMVAVLAFKLVVVAPAAKVARPPCVDTPVTLKVAAWRPPLKVDVAGEPKVRAPVVPLMVRAAVVEVASAVDVAR
jgi:hypothetical protein